jgi:uncharacterized protein YecT (DUF1311 family)
MHRFAISAAVFAGLTGFAWAQDKPPAAGSDDKTEACDGGTVQMMECLGKQRDAWDKELNKLYRAALADAHPEQRAALRTAQRAWLKFRDANCNYYLLGEGSIAKISAAQCQRDMTEHRARELTQDPYQ